MDFLQKRLLEREAENSFRKLRIETNKIDCCSNDYLGIATNDLIQINKNYKHGSSGSRLLRGNYALIEETEKIIASFHHAEAALIYNSGYDANVGLLSCIADRESTIIYDQLSHASIRDGIKLSKAQSFSFIHNDMEDLEKKLGHAKGNIFIVTEAVFSMDGDLAPLGEIVSIGKKYNANLIVDEAHSIGVIGENGSGLAQQLNLEDDCFARVFTFGKACGVHGAAVAGSKVLIDYLINFSRSFIYTTALPESSIAAIKRSYELFPKMIDERNQLLNLIKTFQESGLPLCKSPTPIQILLIPGNEAVKEKSMILQKENYDIRPIIYPTVPKGLERLRIVLHSFNTNKQLEKLVDILKN